MSLRTPLFLALVACGSSEPPPIATAPALTPEATRHLYTLGATVGEAYDVTVARHA